MQFLIFKHALELLSNSLQKASKIQRVGRAKLLNFRTGPQSRRYGNNIPKRVVSCGKISPPP